MNTKSIKSMLIALFLFVGTAIAGNFNANKQGIVLEGYDVVSYHTQYKALRGSSNHSVAHKGQHFWFASAESKSLFQKNPEKYLPEFGGYCAFAVAALAAKVPADPETFKIVDEKLYVFFNGSFKGESLNTIIPWNADEKNMKKKAYTVWKTLK